MIINSKELHGQNDSKYVTSRAQDKMIERLLKQGEELEKEKEAIAGVYQQQEMEDCTFKPVINRKPSDKGRRGFKNFMADLKKFEQRKQDKKRELQKELLEKEDDLTYHPKVCKKSRQMLRKKRRKKGRKKALPFHKRLHYNKRNQLQKQIQDMLDYDAQDQES